MSTLENNLQTNHSDLISLEITIDDMPDDMIRLIFSKLNQQSIKLCQVTQKRWICYSTEEMELPYKEALHYLKTLLEIVETKGDEYKDLILPKLQELLDPRSKEHSFLLALKNCSTDHLLDQHLILLADHLASILPANFDLSSYRLPSFSRSSLPIESFFLIRALMDQLPLAFDLAERQKIIGEITSRYAELGLYDRAQDYLEKNHEKSEKAYGFACLSRCAIDQDLLEQAIACFSKTAEDPDWHDATVELLVNTYLEKDDHQQAMIFVEKINKENDRAILSSLKSICFYLIEIDRFEEVIRVADTMPDSLPEEKADEIQEFIQKALEKGSLDLAKQLLELIPSSQLYWIQTCEELINKATN